MSTPVAVLLSEVQLATLKQLVDTFAPEVARDDDPSGFWARRALLYWDCGVGSR